MGDRNILSRVTVVGSGDVAGERSCHITDSLIAATATRSSVAGPRSSIALSCSEWRVHVDTEHGREDGKCSSSAFQEARNGVTELA
jgi:hypothetical protein